VTLWKLLTTSFSVDNDGFMRKCLFRVTNTKRAFFMGNALVIGLIEKVGKIIASEIKNY
jgi:hypothetical protein